MRLFNALCCAIFLNPLLAQVVPEQTRHIAVVLAENWEAPCGFLYLLDRDDGEWRLCERPWPVTLGARGMGWGKGEKEWVGDGPVKREGDNKSPAGLFAIRERLYGYDGGAPADMDFPYTQLTQDWIGVDDPNSLYYNQVFDQTGIAERDWNSREKMRRDDHLYRWLMVIEHNTATVEPGAGSCIFLHLWRDPGHPTAGCTAMSEANLLCLARRLERGRPLILQLPFPLYQEHREELQLPLLTFPPES